MVVLTENQERNVTSVAAADDKNMRAAATNAENVRVMKC